jgi:hypothetical protein
MPHSKVQLVLVLARKSRGADHWDKDDYDVRFGDRSGPVVGRIMRHPQAPEAQPWFWTIRARGQTPSVHNRGYAASRGQAMRHFRRVRRAIQLSFVCFFRRTFYFRLCGLGCKLSPIFRQDEKVLPKRWRHLLGTSFTLSGVGQISHSL